MNLTLSARKIARASGILAVLLILAHIVSRWLVVTTQNETITKVMRFFDLEEARGLPALFNLALLLCIALLLFLIGFAHQREQGGFNLWFLMGVVFLFLTYDGFYGLHETLNIFSYRLEDFGLPYINWIYLYGIGALIVGAAFLRFIWDAPVQFRTWCIIAGILFVVGAVGLERLGDTIFEQTFDATNPVVMLLNVIEESCEFAGQILFLYALLWYMEYRQMQMNFSL